MSADKDGGPAFPHEQFMDGAPGMSLRDWFAGQVLAGLCAGDAILPAEKMATFAYGAADEMLAARKAGGK